MAENPIVESEESIQRVNNALMAFRGDVNGLEHILRNAEHAYLETYVAWRTAEGDRGHLLDAHHKVRDFRDKLLEVKKLVDELDCEGDRLLQFVHALRT